jgi:hypothetical protein
VPVNYPLQLPIAYCLERCVVAAGSRHIHGRRCVGRNRNSYL